MESEELHQNAEEIIAQAEQMRERHRIRTRERREQMTTEERQVYNARRNAQSTFSVSAERRREINRDRQRQRRQMMSPEQREAQNARRRQLYRERRISNEQHHHEASTSNAQTSGPNIEIVTGRVSIRSIPIPRFNSTSANQFEASTSRVPPSNNEGDDVNEHVLSSSSDAENEPQRNPNRTRRMHTNFVHNCARNCYPANNVRRLELPRPKICSHCRAKLFHRETQNICCNEGSVKLPEIPVPAELFHLFTDESAEGRNFRQNIRAYNHVFSFTSLGVTLDESVHAQNQGIYTFRAHGAIYHRIGSLIPHPGLRPRYLQMFLFATENELQHRLQENSELDAGLIEKITRILNAHNPFVKTFRQLERRTDIHDCRLLIRERPSADRQYTLPTASQVAAILVGGEEIIDASHRDIMVQSISGQLIGIKEYSGHYDPLQYPLLLPYGTYGWYSECESINGTRITCCDYYAYALQIRGTITSILLHGGRLLQQYVVENYVKIETQKLRWFRFHQNEIRAEFMKDYKIV